MFGLLTETELRGADEAGVGANRILELMGSLGEMNEAEVHIHDGGFKGT